MAEDQVQAEGDLGEGNSDVIKEPGDQLAKWSASEWGV